MSSLKKTKKPSLYEYSDYRAYRAYLRDYYHFKKERNPQAFSFRIFSKRVGIAAPNYLKLVMEGQRNLSDKMIPRFAKALLLQERQAEFFQILVWFNQAKKTSQKETSF